ncbi:Por secretion system C-terminal sorting domain-containing protein [Catalinimonas alkaloidigena]|uniref:Por secretion system C-terminal sorting domain-containing protein n=1 Tax=Catalinimonas alkaloidigena TaxID=1075417 RepID=A0A1G9AS48_9BACT|nr:T9SS type A sorting domain-containing protein [Catalinimonas alkaloidigena]SDK29460.1 Por secretion system C-terminal sorting domain-containing protein [Catalinimonas alkaloidigena]
MKSTLMARYKKNYHTVVTRMLWLTICMLPGIFSTNVAAQSFTEFSDYFEDGNITANPAWTASLATSNFAVTTTNAISGAYSLAGANNSDYLYRQIGTNVTMNGASGRPVVWEFIYRDTQAGAGLATAPNIFGNNAARVWLMANNSNVASATTNGYLIQQKSDGKFYLQKSASGTITNITSGYTGSGTTHSIKITKSKAGEFRVYIDPGTGGASTLRMTVTDATVLNTAGNVYTAIHSSTAGGVTHNNRFLFDNVAVYTPQLQASHITSGLTNLDLEEGSTNQPVFGVTLTAQINTTLTAMQFGLSENMVNYLSEARLYRSSDAVYDSGTDVLVGTLTGPTTQLNFTGLSESLSSTPTHYFIVVDVKSAIPSPPTAELEIYLTHAGLTDSEGLAVFPFWYTGRAYGFSKAYDNIGSGNWETDVTWNPARAQPFRTDVLRFNGTAATTVGGTASDTISQLLITNGSFPTFEYADTVLITGFLQIDATSSLTINSSSTVIQLASSATAEINGTLTVNGGVFDFGDAQVSFGGSGVQPLGGSGTYRFGSGGAVTVQAGAELVLNTDISFEGLFYLFGDLDIGANTLTMSGLFSSAGNLKGGASSNLILAGSGGGIGTIVFDPGSAQLNNLTMDRTSFGFAFLGNDLTVHQLNMLNGYLLLGSYNLTVEAGGTITGGSNDSYVYSIDQPSEAGVGFFQATPAVGVETLFPIGSGGYYTPLAITNDGTLNEFKVRSFSGIYEQGTSGALVSWYNNAIRYTWQVEPTAGNTGSGADIALKLFWYPDAQGGEMDLASAGMGRYSAAISLDWENLPTATQNLASAPYWISTSGLTTFSKFSIGGDLTPLPITLRDFRGHVEGHTAHLMWQTATEINNAGFYIERSYDGVEYRRIGFVAGAGNANAPQTYRFADPACYQAAYYRLEQVDFDGSAERYAPIFLAPIFAETLKAQLYPNPGRGAAFTIQYECAQPSPLELRIHDAQGRPQGIYQYTEPQPAGEWRIETGDLAPGVYFVQLRDKHTVWQTRYIKL